MPHIDNKMAQLLLSSNLLLVMQVSNHRMCKVLYIFFPEGICAKLGLSSQEQIPDQAIHLSLIFIQLCTVLVEMVEVSKGLNRIVLMS